MENKVKTLKIILTIGAVILLIAGISFQFVSSIEAYVRVITMLLISGVFGFLSYYEDKFLDYKSGSITSHIFGCVGVLITYISMCSLELLGEWFSFGGDGSCIYLAVFFFLIALLIAISTVRYKIYKLLELSLWISVFGVYMIFMHFNVDYRLAMSFLLGVLLVNNIIRINNYSKWFTIVLSILSLVFIDNSVVINQSVLMVALLSNMIFILFKNNTIKLLPLIISLIAIALYAVDTINITLVGVVAIAILDFVIAYFKVIDTPTKGVFNKIIISFFYLLLVFIPVSGSIKYIIPCVVLLGSLSNIYLAKDSREEYILPIKAFYFTLMEMCYLPIKSLKLYLIVFSVNIVNLLLYFLAKKPAIRYINLGLLVIINIFALIFVEKEVIASIVYLVLFALDFYIVYVREEKANLAMSIIYIVYAVLFLSKFIVTIDSIFFLVAILVYGLYLCIAKKNKIIFTTALVMFGLNAIHYCGLVIEHTTICGFIDELIILITIALFQHVVLDKNQDKVIFIAITVGMQVLCTLIMPVNVLLKIFVLVESIGLVAISMIDDTYKPLYDEGLVGVVISLIFIIGTFDSLPKSLYLIIIGLIIIITVPIIIKRYLIRIEEQKKIEAAKPKVEPKPTEYHKNFCATCGTKIDEQFKFCPKCGSKIE